MAAFAVHLSGSSIEESAQQLRDTFPNQEHFRISERFYLVHSDSIAQTVAEKIGISGAGDPFDSATGVVFKLNRSYFGFESRALWEWLTLGERSSGE